MNRLEIGSSAFNQVLLHDVPVYALSVQRLKCEVNLVLDIDYAAWNRFPDNHYEIPATLTFLDVVDLQIHLDWGTSLRREEPYGVICDFSGQMIIYDFRRFAYTDPIYTERSYWRYELDFSDPRDGRISLGAKDFTIVGRHDPVRSNQQTLDPDQRPPLTRGG
ncbi:MAG TPA: hypothetical protein PLU87_05885 [Sedimentisphaerales bacterium]|nr:hypothetical protein [Sedimentisphaerales bacterium]HRS10383.1 hypothetical protein [Sedimentisphaerales bacterium]HRV47088.1 hypothetical protein [Sedimentisphaerales bacterium]